MSTFHPDSHLAPSSYNGSPLRLPQIAHPSLLSIARTAGALILSQGGVVRGVTNWGPFLLTKPFKKNQKRHDSGHHFIMRFDASPAVQQMVRKTVAIDPRMIRCGCVKLGSKLKDIVDVKGTVTWQRRKRDYEAEYGLI